MPKTILVADDSITVRRVVELAFQNTDLRVETVGSGAEALERLERIRPDLVLADVVMPEPSGYEICRHVKDSPSPVPVLLLAGAFERFDESRARSCGADGHLVKPFGSAALHDRVHALLDAPASAPEGVEPEDPGARDEDDEVEAVFEDWAVSFPSAASPVGEPPEWSSRADVLPESLVEEVETEAREGTEAEAGAEPSMAPPPTLDPSEREAIVREVVRRLSKEVVREVAREVVPDLAETIIRERIRQLEQEADE